MKQSLFMKNKDDRTYLEHIMEAVGKIEKYVKLVADFEDFSKNDLVFDAIVRELEIIGEASNNISDEFQKEHADIPWRKIVGIRNTLIHEYFGVNKLVVWETSHRNLKELKAIVKPLLK
ncbi:MAG: hypothetical protein UR99_C0025G0015 [Candidatus Moranbacteria bacterium GW2011_GWD2_36_12]|nr:MAG: hypothetical protein UR99_C0025G0015 [Candidatus Moranbacteria bacterium GW2011_GWD2_36_12]KKQ06065.1 MAG: hypothetical protein US16_C0026G0015 [Candidatus Moranbacteria bacterium GW2011_GWE2_36_40]